MKVNDTAPDRPYLLLLLPCIALTILSILSLSVQSLRALSLPLDTAGIPCPPTAPYLQLLGPRIQGRNCVAYCEEGLRLDLGGLCVGDRVEHVLRETGEYQHVETKAQVLARFRVIGGVVGLVTGLALGLGVGVEVLGLGRGVVVAAVLSAAVAAWVLYSRLSFSLWLSGVLALLLLLTYTLVHTLAHPTPAPQPPRTPLLPRLLISLSCLALAGLCCVLVLFQYLSCLSTSPYYTWTPPSLYYEVNGLTYKQILIIIQALYMISWVKVLNEGLVASMEVSGSLSGVNLGSVSKLALIRLVFAVPIFLLTLIKVDLKLLQPTEQSKLASTCHCLCGLLLNTARRYSLPVLAYQACLTLPLPLSQCARRLHYQSHINSIQAHPGYVYDISLGVVLGSVGACAVAGWEGALGLPIDGLALGVVLLGAAWLGGLALGGWLWGAEAGGVRGLCEGNRGPGQYQLTVPV